MGGIGHHPMTHHVDQRVSLDNTGMWFCVRRGLATKSGNHRALGYIASVSRTTVALQLLLQYHFNLRILTIPKQESLSREAPWLIISILALLAALPGQQQQCHHHHHRPHSHHHGLTAVGQDCGSRRLPGKLCLTLWRKWRLLPKGEISSSCQALQG